MLIPILALAMMQSPDLYKGSALYSDCKTYLSLIDKTRTIETQSASEAGYCIGYVNGFSDAMARGSSTFCPMPVPATTLVRVYIAYMDKNPKLFDEYRSVTLALALTDAYPCKAK